MNFFWTTNVRSPLYQDALKIRKKVFVEEQKVPVELEVDELEDKTDHVVGYIEEKPVATARIYEKEAGVYKVQRVAVLKESRKQKTGSKLMLEIERYVLEQNGRALVLDAQDHAIRFYEKLNYQVEGEGFMDAGIPHHKMTKKL